MQAGLNGQDSDTISAYICHIPQYFFCAEPRQLSRQFVDASATGDESGSAIDLDVEEGSAGKCICRLPLCAPLRLPPMFDASPCAAVPRGGRLICVHQAVSDTIAIKFILRDFGTQLMLLACWFTGWAMHLVNCK